MAKKTLFQPQPSQDHPEQSTTRIKTADFAATQIENASTGCTKYGQVLKRYGKSSSAVLVSPLFYCHSVQRKREWGAQAYHANYTCSVGVNDTFMRSWIIHWISATSDQHQYWAFFTVIYDQQAKLTP